MESVIGPVPDDWQQVPLIDHFSVQTGPGGSSLQKKHLVGTGVPVVNGADLADGRIRPPSARVNPQTRVRLARYELRAGDVVFARIGQRIKYAPVGAREAGWLIGGSCIRMRPRGEVSGEYLVCYLSHPGVADWLSGPLHRQIVPSATAPLLGALPLVVPPADVRASIVEVTGVIERKARAHEDVARATRTLLDSVVREMLGGQLHLQD